MNPDPAAPQTSSSPKGLSPFPAEAAGLDTKTHKVSQREAILAYLKAGGKLTVLTALEKFGCYALSQRCGELRRQGHPILATMIRTPSGKDVAEYSYYG